jgi:hypothetical protein
MAVAEEVSDAFVRRGYEPALIGAMAMAAHDYTRATRDIDLGVVGVPLATLLEVADELRAAGHTVLLRHPEVDREALHATCSALRLDRKLKRVLDDLAATPDDEPVP